MARDRSGFDIDKYAVEVHVESDSTLTVHLINDGKRVKQLNGPSTTSRELLESHGYLAGFTCWWRIPVFFTFSNAGSLGASHRMGIANAQRETEERRIDGRLAPWRDMFGPGGDA